MKLCLSIQQNEYLKYADEIKFFDNEKNKVLDTIEKYPEHTYIWKTEDLSNEQNLKDYKKLKGILENKLVIATRSFDVARQCQEDKVRFYFDYQISSYYELNSIITYGVDRVIFAAPLFFEIQKIKERYKDISILAIPNIAYMDGLNRPDGVCGTWIRPEDLKLYEPYVDYIEFLNCTGDEYKEQALTRIYWIEKEWPGELNDLIFNFNHEGYSGLLDDKALIHRLNCGQRCQSGRHCRICYRALHIATPDFLNNYREYRDAK